MLKCEDPQPTITKIGNNLEVFEYDGYHIEVSLHADYLNVDVYLKGLPVMGGRSSRSGFTWEHGPSIVRPNYKVRAYLREYAMKRLTELKAKK